MADPVTNAHIREDVAEIQAHTTPNTTSSSAASADADTAAAKAQATLLNARDTVVSGAQAAMESIQNNPTYQQIRDGPMAENVRTQANLTSSEFQDLASAKNHGETAATGQPLTHYHSMLYKLLSWENPRATAIVFASSIAFIFTTRYLNLLHYVFKFSYIVLGVTAALEIAGKLLFDDGLASKMRPRKYWTVSKESLQANLGDADQLLNFFVIEAQRILYAENIYATIAVFFAALISYGLIKIVPFWGLALMADSVMFLAPLIYVKNREVIDSQVEHVADVVNQQTHQLRDLAVHHAKAATEQVQAYTQEYTHKASDYINQRNSTAAGTSTGPTGTTTTTGMNRPIGTNPPIVTTTNTTQAKLVSTSDFPNAPKLEPVGPTSTNIQAQPAL